MEPIAEPKLNVKHELLQTNINAHTPCPVQCTVILIEYYVDIEC